MVRPGVLVLLTLMLHVKYMLMLMTVKYMLIVDWMLPHHPYLVLTRNYVLKVIVLVLMYHSIYQLSLLMKRGTNYLTGVKF